MLFLLADTTASWTGAPPSAIGIAVGLVGLAVTAIKMMYSAQTKTLELERERVAQLTEALRRRNESIEERVLPALIASAEATKAVLKATRRDSRD